GSGRVLELIDARPGRQTVEDGAVVKLLPEQQDVSPHLLVVDPIAGNGVDQLLQGFVIQDDDLDRHAGALFEGLLDPRGELWNGRRRGREDDVARVDVGPHV